MKKKLLSALLAVVLLFGMIPASAGAANVTDFTDVKPGAWYYGAVSYATDRGLFQGTSNTTFSPDTPMSRGMFVTVLGRFGDIPKDYSSTKATFTDTNAGDYFYPYASWACDIGVVSGVGDNRFAPHDSVTREQMAVMLYRFAAKAGYFPEFTEEKYQNFTDTGKVSPFAVDALKWAATYDIIKGSDGRIDPQGKATRAQVAQIMLNFFDFIRDKGTPPEPAPSPSPVPTPSPTPEVPSMPWEDYDPQYERKTGKSATDAQGGYYDYDLANAVMDLIDDLRVQNGMEKLIYHPTIQGWTDIRAKETYTKFSHTRPDGSSCETVGYFIHAENLAWITTRSNNAETIVMNWYNSDGHKRNMLNSYLNLGSVSCYVIDNKIYAAHLFSNKPLYVFDNVV